MMGALALLVAMPLAAQEPMVPPGPARERLEELKKIRLIEQLKLDEETSVRFFSRYNKNAEEMRALGKKRDDLIDELQLKVKRNAPDAEYKSLLAEIMELGSQAIEQREKYFDDLAEILPASKLATYIVFERNFYANIRDLMRQYQRERTGRGPPR
jgi:hypothetical protein